VSTSLRKVSVPIISNSDCNKTKYKNKISAGMVSADEGNDPLLPKLCHVLVSIPIFLV